MENRIQYIFLGAIFLPMLFLSSETLAAPEQNSTKQANAKVEDIIVNETVEETIWDEASVIVEPEIERRKIDVADIDAQDLELGIFFGQMNVEDFGTNVVAGFSLTYHVTEDIFASASFGQTDTEPTSFEVISGIQLLTDDQRTLQYYDLSVGLNLLPGEGFVGSSYAFNSAFYGTIGIGSTDFAGDQRFTVSGAVGYRLVMQDWLAFHVEVKDQVFDIDILGTDKTTHNLNYNIGFSVFF